jgi:Flp pilus assembly CpaE family ATPase
MFSRHESGISVISQVGSLDDLDKIDAEALPTLVGDLRRLFDVLVIDGVRDFSDNVLAILDVADKIAIVTVQEVLAVRRARWAFNILRKIGYDPRDLTVVVNRYETPSEIPLKTIEKIFAPAVVLPVDNDSSLVRQSLNRGVPVGSLNAGHRLTKDVERIAANLIGRPIEDLDDVSGQGRSWLSRLAFWRKKS